MISTIIISDAMVKVVDNITMMGTRQQVFTLSFFIS